MERIQKTVNESLSGLPSEIDRLTLIRSVNDSLVGKLRTQKEEIEKALGFANVSEVRPNTTTTTANATGTPRLPREFDS